jgi:hypothetical protein
LREKFDVLIFVDGAIPGRGGGQRGGGGAGGGDQPPSESGAGPLELSLPAEFRGRRGSVTVARTVPQLKQFLESGGTVLAIGSSTSLGEHLGLPLANHLVETDKDGKPQSLTREKFYVPGSLLAVRLDQANPLAWGLGETADVMFMGSPTYRFRETAAGSGESSTSSLQRVAWFEGKAPLRSGWAWGQEHLDGGIAVVETQVGSGRLVLYGPQILFRAQPHGTFKLLFNGIVHAGAKE